MMPPSILMLRIRSLLLPLPLFLLWPLLLIAGLLAGAGWLLMGMPRRGRCHSVLIALRAFGAMRGLEIDVADGDHNILLKFI